jgi:hypothetical protein
VPHYVLAVTFAAAIGASMTANAGIAARIGQDRALLAKTAADPQTPQQHLDEAKRLLDGITEPSLSTEVARRIANLKCEFNILASAYPATSDSNTPTRTSGSADGCPAGSARDTGTSITGNASASKRLDWRTAYAAVDRALTELVGSGSNVPVGSSTADPVPPSGGLANLSATVRGQLQEVRTHLTLFYAGTLGPRDSPKK